MTLAQNLFYPVFLVSTFILTLIFIPKKDYKTYLIYGLIIGGLGDFVLVSLMQNIFNVMSFKNQGIFNVLGQIALSPPSWAVSIMLFLFFLPTRKFFLYIYIVTWGLTSVSYGYVVHNVGLFDFEPWLYPIPSFIIFLTWWSFTAWIFLKTSDLRDKDS